MSRSVETPWKPATRTIRSWSSASWIRRARTSTIFALPCDVSVTIPACEPVSEIASCAEVVDRHRGERARDALADRDQHVQLARLRLRRDLVREPDEIVGRVAHRREHRDDAVAPRSRGRRRRARDVLDLAPGPRPRCRRTSSPASRGAARRRPRRRVAPRIRSSSRQERSIHISRRPESARPSVTSSAYSRSRADGQPAREPGHAHAAAQAVGEVGRRSPRRSCSGSWRARPPRRRFARRGASSSSMRRCSGSTPSSGESAPPRTW